MKKSNYQSLTCGRCGQEFLIPKKQYEPKNTYYCPICRSEHIATEKDLGPVKPFRKQPVIAERE